MAPKRRRTDSEDDDDYEDDYNNTFVAAPEESKLADLLERDIVRDIDVPWSSICGLTEVKSFLQETTVLPLLRKDIFKGILRPSKGILLYGPPGTGKTSLAKAVATQGETTFFNMSLATISSKWVGEGEKMVRLLFKMARFYAPSVIFIDEVDSICGGSSVTTKYDRKIQAVLLVEMDGLHAPAPKDESEDEEDDPEDNPPSTPQVVVIGATNKPWAIDDPFRRRFERRIYVPLPDAQSREDILKSYLSEVNIKTFNMKGMAAKLKGFSGADIYTVCREAAMCPIRRKLKENDGDLEVVKCLSEMDFRGPITNKDFEASITRCNKTVSKEDVECYDEWTKKYGSQM